MNSQLRSVGERTDPELIYAHSSAVHGAHDGDRVEVTSAFGSTFGRLRIDDTIAPGAVSIPHGWDTTNVCSLTDTDAGVDPHTGMVWQSGLPVTVRPA